MATIERLEAVLAQVNSLCIKAREEDHETQSDLFERATDLLEPLVIEYRDLLAATETAPTP